MSNGTAPCPRMMAISIANGSISVNPPLIRVNRNCQEVRLTLTSDSSGSYPTPLTSAISFPWPVPATVPPPPCGVWTQFPSSGTVTPGPGANQLTISSNRPIPEGSPAECYKFDVHWFLGTTPQTLDPTIENEPFPPGGGLEIELPEQAKGDPPRGPRSDDEP